MEEIKKVGEKKEVKQIVEKIPEDLVKDINKVQDTKRTLLNEFIQVSIQSTNLQKRQQDLLEKMKNNGESLGNKIENAFKKMKLNKRTDISWQYNGRDSFVGVKKPEKKDVIGIVKEEHIKTRDVNGKVVDETKK